DGSAGRLRGGAAGRGGRRVVVAAPAHRRTEGRGIGPRRVGGGRGFGAGRCRRHPTSPGDAAAVPSDVATTRGGRGRRRRRAGHALGGAPDDRGRRDRVRGDGAVVPRCR